MASVTDPAGSDASVTPSATSQDELPKGYARRKSDGAIVDIMASAGFGVGAREAGTWSSDLTAPSGVRSVV
jgi:hypothetical protein